MLNPNTYDVGLHAAMELNADKLSCLHLDDVKGDCGISHHLQSGSLQTEGSPKHNIILLLQALLIPAR